MKRNEKLKIFRKEKSLRDKMTVLKKPFSKRKKREVIFDTEILTEEKRDVFYEIESLIDMFFQGDSGFLKRAQNLTEYTERYMPYDTAVRDIYISAYNSNLLQTEKSFYSLNKKLSEKDADNEYGDYCMNPKYALAKKFVERIKNDRLDVFEGAKYEEYRLALLSYVADLNNEILRIVEGEKE